MYAITACTTLGHSGYADVLHIDGGPFLIKTAEEVVDFLVKHLNQYGSLSFSLRCFNAGFTVSAWDPGGSGWMTGFSTLDGSYHELRLEEAKFLELLKEASKI